MPVSPQPTTSANWSTLNCCYRRPFIFVSVQTSGAPFRNCQFASTPIPFCARKALTYAAEAVSYQCQHDVANASDSVGPQTPVQCRIMSHPKMRLRLKLLSDHFLSQRANLLRWHDAEPHLPISMLMHSARVPRQPNNGTWPSTATISISYSITMPLFVTPHLLPPSLAY